MLGLISYQTYALKVQNVGGFQCSPVSHTFSEEECFLKIEIYYVFVILPDFCCFILLVLYLFCLYVVCLFACLLACL